MKRILLFTFFAFSMAMMGFAQGTYYWVGGTSTSWGSANNWSLTLGGAGGARSASNTADVLIFDGSNLGGGFTGSISLQPTVNENIGRLVLQNNAVLNLARTTSGTTYLYMNSDVTISQNSTLNITGDVGVMCLVLNNTSNSTIQGQLNVSGTAANRISLKAAGILKFTSGSTCTVNSSTNPFSTLTTTTNPSVDKSVIFQTGSSLIYKSAFNPFGGNSTSNIVVLESGSNFIMETANVSGLFSNKTFGNVTVRNNAAVSLSENFLGIENLAIENGASFLLNGTGPSPVYGNIANNGTLGVNNAVSSNLIMIGNIPQTISGNGAFNLGALSVAEDANVTLNSTINLSGGSISYIYGTLNMQVYQIRTNGVAANTGRIQFRSQLSTSTNAAIVNAGSNVINFNVGSSDFATLNAAPGTLVTGPNFEPNTYVINTSSTAPGSITVSKPALSNGSTVSILGTPGTLVTANPNGIDGNFDINQFGSLSINSGTNLIFNAATNSPFTYSIANNGGVLPPLGDLTFNAAVTTNGNVTANGKLTLNNAKLTIREGDVVSLGATATFNGNFGNSSYIATAANTSTGGVGLLKVNGLSTSVLIPVGTNTHYTPVTLAPTAVSNFDINVFAGATTDRMPNGTALTAAQKLRMVDAVWNVKRTSGTGSVTLTLGWDNALEGSTFATFGDAQIGIAEYNGTNFGAFTGTGNAANNTAMLATANLFSFIVGEANTTLPLTLLNFTAKESLNSVKLAWQTTAEVNLKNYVLQHQKGNGFEDIYTVAANNKEGIFNYSYTHVNPSAGVNYYRLAGVDLDGTRHYSELKWANATSVNALTVYPNPVNKSSFSISGLTKGDVIKMSNIQGQLLATKVASGSEVEEIDVQNIQAGTYILSIENAGKITNTKKVIKL